MDQKKIEALMPLLGTTVAQVRGSWIEASCPFAPWKHESGKDAHPSFGIKVNDKGKSICKCFSCGYGGDLTDLVMDLGLELTRSPHTGYKMGLALQLVAEELQALSFDSDIPDYGESKKRDEFVAYPQMWLDSFLPANVFPEALKYLHDRDLSDAVIKALDIRYDPMQRRVCFPFSDFKGRLAGMQGRAIDATNPLRYYFYDHKSHKNMLVWLGEHHINFDKPVVLVEGPFDYASVYRVYQNVVASFSAGISKTKVSRMADAAEIITFYDHGKGGDMARSRVHEVMKGKSPVTDLVPPNDDLDPGAMPLDMVMEYLQEHVKLSPIDQVCV